MDDKKPEYFPHDPAPADLDGPGYLLRTLLDALPFPFFYQDPEGRMLGCNRAFEQVRNQTQQDMAGMTVFDLMLPEDASRLHRVEQEMMHAGGTAAFPETVHTLAQGTRQIIVHHATFNHADGTLAGLATTVLDVTEQKAAEAALRQSQDLLSTISRNVTDLMSIVDPVGVYQYTSPSYFTVLGYTREEMEACPTLSLIHPDDRAQVKEALATALDQGLQQSVEYRLRHKNGAWLNFESKANPIFPVEGRPVHALIVARDVTRRKTVELERKQMEVLLRHAQKLESIGSLAAGIAHEINTPIQYIGDNTSFLGGALPELLACMGAQRRFLLELQARQALPPEGAEVLDLINRLDLDYLTDEIPEAIKQTLDGVVRVAAIVSAMKDFSHPGVEGKIPSNLNRAIESTLTVSRNEWKYVARLETDLDPALPPVRCLQGEINQAVLNLVVNAAHAIEEALGGRHTGKLGVIGISTRQVGQEVRISVSDNGPGIPEAIRDRIFEPFFTTKPVGKGTGQGLAIVHAVVVEKHGGRVTVETETGRGTTFHLFLPLGDPESPPSSPPEA
ncbi:MAG: PAS domain S-box protein [Holophaga sp.]|nr:PAS domain S-box protein [Holophaga sp.]